MSYTFARRMGNLKASAIREILKFTADPTVISFAAGNPAPEAFPVEEIQAITQDILASTPIDALQYSITEGYPALKESIASVLLAKEPLLKDYDALQIVSGAQQGIELSCKAFCNEGDTILCENPSFIGSLNSFKSYGVKLTGIPLEEEGGMDLNALEDALKTDPNVKLIYVIPNFQNPSGTTMPLEKRKALLALAKQYNVVILEDNPYGELRFAGEHIPSLKSMDTDGHVIYCGSFSKILSPGLRVGFVVAHQDIVQKIVVCKQCSDVHTTILSQMICDQFLRRYDYEAHIARLQDIYRRKSNWMLQHMEAQFNPVISYTKPQGGLFIWCDLPREVDMFAFCQEAVAQKVAVVPGSAFLPSEDLESHSFRINFSTPTDEAIEQGIAILGKLSHTL